MRLKAYVNWDGVMAAMWRIGSRGICSRAQRATPAAFVRSPLICWNLANSQYLAMHPRERAQENIIMHAARVHLLERRQIAAELLDLPRGVVDTR